MHGSLFHERPLVAKDLLILNSTINTCLIRLKIILLYFYSLNTCECIICQIY